MLALTPGLGLRIGEAQGIVDLSTNPADAFGKGITVNAVKYMGFRADERSIYGKRSAMRGQAPVSGGRMRLSAASAPWCAAASAAVSLKVRAAAIGAVPELLQHLCRQAAFPPSARSSAAAAPTAGLTGSSGPPSSGPLGVPGGAAPIADGCSASERGSTTAGSARTGSVAARGADGVIGAVASASSDDAGAVTGITSSLSVSATGTGAACDLTLSTNAVGSESVEPTGEAGNATVAPSASHRSACHGSSIQSWSSIRPLASSGQR